MPIHPRVGHVLCVALFGALATLESGCVHRGVHSVHRWWADYNTLRAPALYFEQVDHLPYHAAHVGYFRWMYDRDPGHQLACLGPPPPPVCCEDPAVPPGDQPFDFQVPHSSGIPGNTETLWGSKLPEAINVSPRPGDEAGAGTSPSSGRPQTEKLVPILPPAPTQVNERQQKAPQAAPARPVQKRPAPLPTFDAPPPLPRSQPLDEDSPPVLGPDAGAESGLRLTTQGAAGSRASSSEIRWPR
jgi:hypothetical protein